MGLLQTEGSEELSGSADRAAGIRSADDPLLPHDLLRESPCQV